MCVRSADLRNDDSVGGGRFGRLACFPFSMNTMERRRLERPRPDTRKSLEQAVRSWQRLSQAWKTIFAAAQAVHNLERMALES